MAAAALIDAPYLTFQAHPSDVVKKGPSIRKPFGRGFLLGVSRQTRLFCPPPQRDFAQGRHQLQCDQLLPRLCLTPPPLSSGSVGHTDDSIDYSASVSEPGAEESEEETKLDG